MNLNELTKELPFKWRVQSAKYGKAVLSKMRNLG